MNITIINENHTLFSTYRSGLGTNWIKSRDYYYYFFVIVREYSTSLYQYQCRSIGGAGASGVIDIARARRHSQRSTRWIYIYIYIYIERETMSVRKKIAQMIVHSVTVSFVLSAARTTFPINTLALRWLVSWLAAMWRLDTRPCVRPPTATTTLVYKASLLNIFFSRLSLELSRYFVNYIYLSRKWNSNVIYY